MPTPDRDSQIPPPSMPEPSAGAEGKPGSGMELQRQASEREYQDRLLAAVRRHPTVGLVDLLVKSAIRGHYCLIDGMEVSEEGLVYELHRRAAEGELLRELFVPAEGTGGRDEREATRGDDAREERDE